MRSDYDVFSELFDYDSDTGVITRRLAVKAQKAGSIPGCLDQDGYTKVSVNRKTYLAHRIAWLLHFGEWPSGMLDHIDGDKQNNRIANLRLATSHANQRNRKITATNTSGVNGVVVHKVTGKWQAQASRTIEGKKRFIHLGLFDSLFDAAAARKSFELKNGYSHRHGSWQA